MGKGLLGRRSKTRIWRLQIYGRWRVVAEAIEHYGLKDARILERMGGDFSCMSFRLNCEVVGVDIFQYAIGNAKDEVGQKSARRPESSVENDCFDLVYSITTLHNLFLPDLISP